MARLHRRGINLLEIMIVVAIITALTAVMVPMVGYSVKAKERSASNRIGILYTLLQDEAVLGNVTFRVAFHLDDNYFEVEAGGPDTLVFDNADDRLDYEQSQHDKLHRGSEEGPSTTAFAKINDKLHGKTELPSNLRIVGVYTPQYGDFVRPLDEEDVDPEDKQVVYSYVFANGFTEHTVIQVGAYPDDPRGFTVEVEPMTGRVYVDQGMHDWDERFDFVPEEGPALPD